MIKHLWVNLLWKSKPLGFRKYIVGGGCASYLVELCQYMRIWIWKVFIQMLSSSGVGFWSGKWKWIFRTHSSLKTKPVSNVVSHRENPVSLILWCLSILEKPFSDKSVAFFTVVFNSFQIFVSFLFKMFS